MKTITYRELAVLINGMDEEMKDKDITIHVEGEYFPAELLCTGDEDDILDSGHPYFNIKNNP